MDFIFVALALQLIFLLTVIIFGSDKIKLRIKSKSLLNLREFKSIFYASIKNYFYRAVGKETTGISLNENLPPRHYFDYELKSQSVTISTSDISSAEKITETSRLESLANDASSNSATCQVLLSFSTKVGRLMSRIKSFIQGLTGIVYAQSQDRFDFSQLDNLYSSQSTKSENLVLKSSASFLQFNKLKSGFIVSPFRPNDQHYFLRRKIQRKILKIELVLLRTGKNKILNVIAELPELENLE